mmetsp:Transcript_48902/g.126087  ORF Transcript_48902/g.126087 Transcript_48902/m.126087 type:complete len:243 (-) Transcript_48902:552-1280(-)
MWTATCTLSSFQVEQTLSLLEELEYRRGHLLPLWILVRVPLAQQQPEILRTLLFWLHVLEHGELGQHLLLGLRDLGRILHLNHRWRGVGGRRRRSPGGSAGSTSGAGRPKLAGAREDARPPLFLPALAAAGGAAARDVAAAARGSPRGAALRAASRLRLLPLPFPAAGARARAARAAPLGPWASGRGAPSLSGAARVAGLGAVRGRGVGVVQLPSRLQPQAAAISPAVVYVPEGQRVHGEGL